MVTTNTIAEKLVDNALRGRGLWIGLFAERSAQHELYKHEIEELTDSRTAVMTPDTHVTIAHLGKKNDRHQVEAAITSCHVLSDIIRTTDVGVEALARFTWHVVAIVSTKWIDDVVSKVQSCLADHLVFPDASFAGIRHVTMLQIKDRSRVSSQIPMIKRYDLRFSRLSVVCGDERMDFALLAQSAELF